MTAHVYRVTPRGAEPQLVMAKTKPEAKTFIVRDIDVERLSSQEVVDAMRAGAEILNANPPAVDPAQTEFEGLAVIP